MTVNKDEIQQRIKDKIAKLSPSRVDLGGYHSGMRDAYLNALEDIALLASDDAKEETIRQLEEKNARYVQVFENVKAEIDTFGELVGIEVDSTSLEEKARAFNEKVRQQAEEIERLRKTDERDCEIAISIRRDNTALRECLDKHRVFAAHIATRAERDISRFEGKAHVIGSQMFVSDAAAKELLNQARTLLDRKDTQSEEFLIEIECDHEVQTQRGDKWTCDSCGVVVEDTQGEGGR